MNGLGFVRSSTSSDRTELCKLLAGHYTRLSLSLTPVIVRAVLHKEFVGLKSDKLLADDMVLSHEVHRARLRAALAHLLGKADFGPDAEVVEAGIHHAVAVEIDEPSVQRLDPPVILGGVQLDDAPG